MPVGKLCLKTVVDSGAVSPAKTPLAPGLLGSWTSRDGLRERASIIQPIFQDPAASLSPRCRIGTLMGEVGRVLMEPRDQTRTRLNAILGKLGIDTAVLEKYPHEISLFVWLPEHGKVSRQKKQ